MITLIDRAFTFNERIAIKSNGQDYTYSQLLSESESVGIKLLNGDKDLNGARIAFLVPAGFQYACIQWGIWRAGGIAVPLCEKHPLPSISYILKDTEASTVVFSKEFESLLEPLFDTTEIRFIPSETFEEQQGSLPDVQMERSALILYTSGTTGSPKGVVTTHNNIAIAGH